MRILIAMIVLGFTLLSSACTENARTRSWGGESDLRLPCGVKIVDVTWKNSNFWYLTREMREGEVPESYVFQEDSSFGVMEGVLHIKESACK